MYVKNIVGYMLFLSFVVLYFVMRVWSLCGKCEIDIRNGFSNIKCLTVWLDVKQRFGHPNLRLSKHPKRLFSIL